MPILLNPLHVIDGPVGVVVVSGGKRTVVAANARAGTILGFDAATSNGRNFEQLLPEGARAAILQALDGKVEAGVAVQIGSSHFDLHVRRLDPKDAGASAADAEAVLLLDVSDRMSAQLEVTRREKLIGNLFGMISHDIRAPLGVIVGALNELSSRDVGVLNEEQQFLLGLVRKSVERLSRLASNVVYLGRMESGTAQLTRRRVDLRVPVQHVIGETQRVDAGSSVRIVANLPTERLEADVDAERITQVLSNLLANAVRFAKKQITVTLAVDSANPKLVHLVVEDDGPGIPAAAIDTIFERFSRVDAPRTGTGLGLAIVRGIVLGHGGEVSATNLNQQNPTRTGARIDIRLPRNL